LTRTRGKLDKFSLDVLVNIATAAGFKLHIQPEEAKAALLLQGRRCAN
jgi:hypothetical protein